MQSTKTPVLLQSNLHICSMHLEALLDQHVKQGIPLPINLHLGPNGNTLSSPPALLSSSFSFPLQVSKGLNPTYHLYLIFTASNITRGLSAVVKGDPSMVMSESFYATLCCGPIYFAQRYN